MSLSYRAIESELEMMADFGVKSNTCTTLLIILKSCLKKKNIFEKSLTK